jgi:hypothetical protein
MRSFCFDPQGSDVGEAHVWSRLLQHVSLSTTFSSSLYRRKVNKRLCGDVDYVICCVRGTLQSEYIHKVSLMSE